MRMRYLALMSLLSLVVAVPPRSSAGDAFVKFGVALNELQDSFDIGDRWQVAVGSDWKIADTVGLGVELQFAYRKYEAELLVPPVSIPITIREIPINVFGNIKFKPGLDGAVHPYAGAGAGVMGSVNSASTSVGGIDLSTIENTFDGGIHFVAGVELGSRDTAAFLVEFELSRVLRDDSENLYVLYGGIRF